MDSRTGILLSDNEFRALATKDFVISVRESNLRGIEFEEMIVRKFGYVRFPIPLAPILQSSYGIGYGRVEPKIDCYEAVSRPNNVVFNIPTEIKKGFRWINGKPYVTCSKEQLDFLKSRHRVDGTLYQSGRILVFERIRPFRMRNDQRQSMRMYIITFNLIRVLRNEWDRRVISFPDTLRRSTVISRHSTINRPNQFNASVERRGFRTNPTGFRNPYRR